MAVMSPPASAFTSPTPSESLLPPSTTHPRLMPPLVQNLWSRSSNLRGSWQYGINVTAVVATASISWVMNSHKPCQHWRGRKLILEKLGYYMYYSTSYFFHHNWYVATQGNTIHVSCGHVSRSSIMSTTVVYQLCPRQSFFSYFSVSHLCPRPVVGHLYPLQLLVSRPYISCSTARQSSVQSWRGGTSEALGNVRIPSLVEDLSREQVFSWDVELEVHHLSIIYSHISDLSSPHIDTTHVQVLRHAFDPEMRNYFVQIVKSANTTAMVLVVQ